MKQSDLPHNLVAFVSDPVSEQIIWNVIKDKNMAYSEARQGGMNEIIEFLKTNRTPKVLIVDISNFDLPVGDIAKIREYTTPNLSLIVIGTRNDVALFRDLMNLGIVDYLVKPLNDEILSRALDQANGISSKVSKSGKLVQFMSSVGGAGSTTSAVNIAWILANRNFKRVLVMDLDFLYGTANLMLDIKAENAYLDILEAPDKIDDYFVETILRKYDNKLYYLGGLVDLVRGIIVDGEAFATLVDMLKKQFNYILLDSPREVGGIYKTCMNKADRFVIMAEMSLASAQNTARMLEYLSTEQSGKRVTIVANKVGLSPGGALAKESFEKVIDRPIDYIIPLNEEVTLAAANVGQPLAVSPNSLTEVFNIMAEDILGKRESMQIEKNLKAKEGITLDTVKEKAMNLVQDFVKKL